MSSSPRGWAGLLIPQSQNRLIPSTGAQAPYLSSFPLSFPPSLPSFFLFFLTLLEPRVHFYSAHLTQLQVLPTWTREGDLLVWWPPSQPLARSPYLKVSFALLMSCPWLPRGLYPGVLGSFSDWTQGLPFITENSLLGFRLFSFLSFFFFLLSSIWRQNSGPILCKLPGSNSNPLPWHSEPLIASPQPPHMNLPQGQLVTLSPSTPWLSSHCFCSHHRPIHLVQVTFWRSNVTDQVTSHTKPLQYLAGDQGSLHQWSSHVDCVHSDIMRKSLPLCVGVKVTFSPKTHNVSLTMWKTSDKSTLKDILQNTWPLLWDVQIIKNRGSRWHHYSPEAPQETWRLMHSGVLDGIPDQEKDSEIWVRSEFDWHKYSMLVS